MIGVTCALIINEKGQVLATQRSETMSLPKKWEFPGGKIEANESASNCLIREIREELDIEISILTPLLSHIYHYPSISICLMPFVCKMHTIEIHLKEHSSYRWLGPSEVWDLDWAEADIQVVEKYLKYINEKNGDGSL